MERRERQCFRTFGDFDALDTLVIHTPSCLFEEFVPLSAKIDDRFPFDRESDEFFHNIVYNVSSRLRNPCTMIRAAGITIARNLLDILCIW